MKKLSTFLFALALVAVMFVQNVYAQIPVTVTNPTNTTPNLQATYVSLALALTDLNLVSAMTGPVTLTLTAGNSETAPPTGLTIGSATLNPVLSATNTVTIVSSGGTVTLNAGIGTSTPGSAAPDGILKIVGADYITINGLTFTDGNTTNPATMEFGVALFKLSLSDGAQNNTITNCIFNMQRVNNASGTAPMVDGSVGILVINSIPTAATTALVPTTAAGANSNNKFYTNTINSGNIGIALSGYAASTPFTAGDTGNDIGGTGSGTGNTILNYGGAASATNPAAGIRANNQWGINISYNTINNNNGSGVNHASTLRGIYAQAGTSANATINNNTITVQSGAASSVLTAIENAIGSTAASNTVTINNNIIQNCTYSTATSGAFTGIVNSASAATVNLTGNTVNNNSLPGTGAFTGLDGGGPTTLNMNTNIVTNNSKTGASGTMYCTRAATALITYSGNSVHDNSFTANSGTSASTLYGYYNFGSPTSETYTNNTIYNLSIAGSSTSTSHIFYGLYSNTSSSSNITASGNTIYTLTFSNSSTGAATINGIRIATGTTINVYKNKVYNITSNGASSTAFGLYIAGGTTFNAYNNLIGDIKTPSASAAIPLAGINVAGGTTVNLYYNTVNLNATSTGTLFGSAAIYASSTPTVNLRNNIFVNTSTPIGATGFTAAYRRSTTTLTTYASTSNNNLFYAGTPGTNNLIFYDGTNSDLTLAAFKTRVAPRDAASITENPPFLSTSGSSATFLHISTVIATQIESGGANIATYTDDYDGDTRNATTPDIGADEFAGIALDLTAPSITYTAFGNTLCASNRTLSATITDASGVNTTAGTKPRIWFKKSGNLNSLPATNDNTTDGWKYTEATNASSPFSLTIDYTLVFGGVGSGDVIQYFVIAQDLAPTPNVGINSGTFAAPPTSVALTGAAFPIGGTINSYTILGGGLSTDVTIGVTGTYTSLTGASGLFAAINAGGLTGNITAKIIDPSVTETGANALNAISYGCDGLYTLTIKPDVGVTATLTGAVVSGALIKLNGADYVTIDGSNNGTTSRNLTITNTNAATTSAVVWIGSASASNGATNNTIKNCNITGNAPTTTVGGIIMGSGTTLGNAAEAANSNNTIQNNNFTAVQNGIYHNGFASGLDQNLTITNNLMGSVTAGSKLGFRGLIVINAQNCLISGNTIFGVVTASTSTSTGIQTSGVLNGGVISNNKISDIKNTNTSGYGCNGILLGSTTTGSALKVYNNFIFDVASYGWASGWGAADNGYGIVVSNTGSFNIYYNTVNMTTNQSIAGNSSALNIISSAPAALDIRDNIFVNSQTTGTRYAVYCAAANTVFSNIDYNDYYSTGTNLGYLGGAVLDLAAWQTATGKDANSKNILPVFTSPTDLHLVPASNIALDNLGTPIAGITTDIDNDTRNVTTPDMGADEFTVPSGIDMGATALFAPAAAGCYTAAETVTVTIKNYSINTIDFSVNNVTVSVTATGGYSSSAIVNTGTLAAGATQNVTMPATIDMSASGAYTFNASTSVTGDITPGNDAMTPVTRTNLTLSGTYLVGSGGAYTTLTAAVADYNSASCITGPVTFSLTDPSYSAGETFPITINVSGAGTNTLTIKPATGITPSITGAVASGALIKLNGADYIIIDGSNSGGIDRSLTITNTSTTSPTAISLVSLGTGAGATNNTIKNCNISTGVSSAIGYGIAVGGNTPGTSGADNDNVTLQNNSITVATISIYAYGTASESTGGMDNLMITGNSVNTNTGTSITNTIGIQVGYGLNCAINNNTISVQTSASASPVGISLETGFISSTVNANNITNVTTTSTGGYGGRGITVGTGSATSALTISNNFISGVNGSNYSSFTNSSSMGIGIGMIGGSSTLTTVAGGINLYYNTVNMYGSYSYSTACLTAAIYVGSAATSLDIRDNIFVNSLNNTNGSGTLSKNYAIYSAAANTAYSDINFNDYYVSGTQGVFGYLGGDQATLAAWQTATGKDANSQNIAPVFTSNTDLHLVPASNIALDNLGTPIAGITTDFDNDTRDGTTPDMGADEFTVLTGVDMGATALVAPAASGCYTASETVTVTIKNYSINTIDFSVNNVTVTVTATGGYNSNTIVNTGTLASGATQDVTMPATIDMSANGSYTFNASTSVTGDVTPGNDAMTPVTRNSLSGSGTFTVGSTGNYTTLTAAVDAYNSSSCITGPITFSLTDATYPSETFPITINANAAASATNTLTIKPATSSTPAISGALASGALIKILNNYTVIDGSNSAGGTSRDLTITNSSAISPNVILIGSTGTTPIIGVTVKNCVLINGATTSTAVVVSDGTTIGNAGYFNDITIQNNSIQKAYMGIYNTAVVGASNGSGLLIKGNDLNTSGTNAIRYAGIYVAGVDGGTVSDNNIGNFDQTTGESDKGIWLASGTINTVVEKNNVHDLGYSGTSGYGAQGIEIASGVTSSNNLVKNNFIAHMTGDGDSYITFGGTYNPIGIFLTGTQDGVKLYFNSIYLYGNTLNYSSASASMGICLNTGSVADLQDNIIENNLGLLTSTGYGAMGVYAMTANTQFTDINYNDYYINPTGSAAKAIGAIASTPSLTLAAWQTATGKDANSISGDPKYVSTTDLHIDNTVATPVSNAGVTIGTVTTDIDGDTRNNPPDIGADEFAGFNAVVWNGSSSTDWNTAGNWTANIIPTSSVNATINSGPVNMPAVNEAPATPANSRDLTINSGASLTINAGKALTVTGTLTNNAGNTGLVIKSDATGTGSLIESTAGVAGTVERYLTGYSSVDDFKYHIISSPIAVQPIQPGFVANPPNAGDDFYKWYEPTKTWINSKIAGASATGFIWNPSFGETDFVVGRGYLVAYPSIQTKTFTGTLNTYPTSSPLVLTCSHTPLASGGYGGWNMLGNPFPSSLDWTLIIKSNVDNALYYYDAASQNYVYYIKYSDPPSDPPEYGSGSRYIPPMQGFFVRANSTGSVTIDNTMRCSNDLSIFHKESENTPNNYLVLKADNGIYYDEAFVIFYDQATVNFDGQYDALKLASLNPQVPQLYTVATDNSDLAINSLPVSAAMAPMPLHFKAGTDGNYTITASELNTFAPGTVITLEDLKINKTQNLMQNPVYSFTASTGDATSRFLLHFSGSIGINEAKEKPFVHIYSFGDNIYVSSEKILTGGSVYVFNLIGQQVIYRQLAPQNLNIIPAGNLSGYYLVRVVSDKGSVTGKVFVK